jgi:peptidoglycan/xylan/chitin deacetylase (PgdA/CDA1 family)
MLTPLKRLFYRAAHLAGPSTACMNSRWRSQSLLILCYHGVSQLDEDHWSPLYLKEDLFRDRLRRIRDAGCVVLPLGEAIERLYDKTLPQRSVVLTFDDGFHDFHAKTWPALKEFGYPATVYLTTYYSIYNVPVFDPASWYILWRSRGRELTWPELGIDSVRLHDSNCESLSRLIKNHCVAVGLSGEEKNEVLRELAGRLRFDYDDFCRRRLLHIMRPEEATALATEGVDFQLHSHRHRVFESHARFKKDLIDNGTIIADITGHRPTHFCYPGGCQLPELPGWLAEMGVASATTTSRALATPDSGRYTLPRVLDTYGVSNDEFSAWLSGLANFMPRAHVRAAEGQLIKQVEPSGAVERDPSFLRSS